MPIDQNCKTCLGLGWVGTRSEGCPACNPPLEKPPRRKPRRGLRKQSEKNKRVTTSTAPLRKRWRQQIHTCEVCEQRMATEVHEIVAGKGRHLSYGNPRLWIAVCGGDGGCHQDIQGKPYSQQLEIVVKATERAILQACDRESL